MHLGAAALQQTSMKRTGIDFSPDIPRPDQFDVGIYLSAKPLVAANERLEMCRTRSQFQLSIAREIAIDSLIAHDSCDGIDCAVVGPVPGLRARLADAVGQRAVIDGESVVDVAAIAPRCSPDHTTGFEKHDVSPASRECQRGGQPSETATNDHDVRARGQFIAWRDLRRGGCPVGLEFHGEWRIGGVSND